MPRSALALALSAGALAAVAVAGQRVGLALAVLLLTALAAGACAARARGRPVSRLALALAACLALQPVLRDAGWVVALDVAAALVAGALALAPPRTWPLLARGAAAPLRLVAGGGAVGRAAAAALPEAGARHAAPVVRGLGLAVALTAVFGALFASADSAFAELASDAVRVEADPADLTWRLLLGLVAVAGAGALVRAPDVVGRASGAPARVPLPGRTELRIAIGALVALFAVFVAVQLRVFFGGAGYVRETTGLGFGEYARQGFTQLVLVAALTLALVALAARRSDRVVRALLGALCALTLVVLASAQHRLGLVEDAYGLTRVRLAGQALVPWLAAVFALVLAAGAHRSIAGAAPRIAALGTLGAILAFSLANPDGRVADRAVERFESSGRIDVGYLAMLSADAVPALERLPADAELRAVAPLRRDLERADGLAGLNLARMRAR